VGAFGGANWLNVNRIEGVKIKTKLGFVGGGSLGYKFSNGFRLEGEVAYRQNRLDSKHFARSYGKSLSGKSYSWSYMVNVLYDFDDLSFCPSSVVPYLGVGVGYTSNHGQLKDRGYRIKSSDHGIAYQGIAGIGYKLTEKTTLAVEYRYHRGKEHGHDHGVALALRQSF
jgi:opacity protein-like surface antigen